MPSKPKVAVLFDNLGPYHRARLQAAQDVLEVRAIEFGVASGDYAWRRETSDTDFSHAILNPAGRGSQLSSAIFRQRLQSALMDFSPAAVAVPGWASRGALQAIQWALKHAVPVIMMSESTAHDEVRQPWKEWIKSRLLGCCAAALVGGRAHAAYLQQLGLPEQGVFLGYDAVDNAHFQPGPSAADAGAVGAGSLRAFQPYFLASARFVSKKNLAGLLRAFAFYRDHCTSRGLRPWNLLLLGDGPLRPQLEQLQTELGLPAATTEGSAAQQSDGGQLWMPGFKQYDELPAFYQAASAFIHGSLTEQWGLVVNEAMASALPVLVSARCGCAPDLVQAGVNGWCLDPTDPHSMAERMLKLSTLPEPERQAMGQASQALIAQWGPQRFASGLHAATLAALKQGAKPVSLLDGLLLRLLTLR